MDVVDLEEENRAEQMFEAVKNNDFDLLKKILSESDDAESLTSTIHQESGSTALMFASREGNASIAQLLLDYGAKPLQANAKHGASALHFAKSAEIVYVLLKGKADPLQRDPGGKTALMWAGWSGAREVQEALLKQKGVDVNDRATGSGSTAIHYTATTQHEDCLRLLIKAKGEVNCLSNDGRTPLHYATQTTGTISILLEAKADVNKSGPRAVSVAHIAAENGRKQVLEMLMNAKANLLATDHATGEMPLHFSAKEGKEETMRLILDSKIDVDQRGNRKKRTALMLASVHGHTHIQETLLEEYHADVNLSSSSQMTAAHYAAVKGGSDALKVLLKHSANINARHIDGRTPLYFAAQLKNTHALKLLLESKADIHEADMDQVTPIHAASMHGDVGIIECLLKAKGDVERKDCDGFTALHDAAVSDNLEACRLIRRYLLNSVHQNTIVEEAADQARDHGHDIIGTWLESSLGFTPLHFACDARDVEWVRRILLSDSYLDIDKPSHDGLTPLDVSRKSGEEDGWLEPNPEITAMVCAAASCWKPKSHHLFPKSFRRAVVAILTIRNRGQHGYYSVWNPILRMLGRNHFIKRPATSQLDRKRKSGSLHQLEKDLSRVMSPGQVSRSSEEPPQKRSNSP